MSQGRTIIDIHAHILPGVDDGARTMAESWRMLSLAASQGIRAVIATPHYSRKTKPEEYGYSRLAEELQEKIRRDIPDFSIYLGQETYYHEELAEQLQEGNALTMAGSHYVLVEFDTEVSYEYLYRGVRRLMSAGYWPILAHMERYGCLRREQDLEELAGSGCYLQMNYHGLAGGFLNRETRWRRRQVLLNRIHFLGTDMHQMHFRPPELQGALKWMEKQVSHAQLLAMTWENPLHIIKDERMG